VVFYNTEDFFDTKDDPDIRDDSFTPGGDKNWTMKRYKKKVNDIGRVLTSINSREYPEIIGLAEVENRKVLLDLTRSENFRNAYYGIIHENSPDTRGIDVAMLYRADEFKVVHHQSIPIVFPFDKNSRVRDILYVKGLVSGKDTLHIFINHWKSRVGGVKATRQKRTYSARILKDHTDSIFHHNPGARIVVMGDFNDEPKNNSLSDVLEARCPGKSFDEPALYNLMCEQDKKEIGTYNYKNNWYMLDNLIVSSALLKENGYSIDQDRVKVFDPPWVLYEHPKAGTKVPDRTYGGDNYFGGYSDHLAIYGIFRYHKP
jgi:predicted extracellular nuclease